MSVTDIFPVDTDYPVEVETLDGVLRQQAQDGRRFERPLRADVRRFLLEFRSRPTAELQQILAWSRRMRDQVFLFRHNVWEQGSWNLLGLDAEAEHSGNHVSGGVYYNYLWTGADNLLPLSALGLKAGDIISFSAELRTSAAGGEGVIMRVIFDDKDGTLISFVETTAETGDAYVLHKKENVAIPANTVFLRAVVRGVTSETGFIRRAKVNRGPAAQEFEAPFTATEFVPRFFPVRFTSAVRHRLVAHESHDIEVDLVEAVGQALDGGHYPDPLDLSVSSNFLEETEGTALAGAWTDAVENAARGRAEKTNVNTNTADEFAFTYSGYGFRLWARKDTDLGIVKVLLDDVDMGNVDLYAAGGEDSAPLLTKLDAALGLHTVKLRATNTKNASSSANTIVADALEVMS